MRGWEGQSIARRGNQSLGGAAPPGALRVGCVQPPCCHLSDFLKHASDYLMLLIKQPLPSPLRMFQTTWASQVVLVVTNLAASAGDIRNVGLIPGSGRCPGGGHGNPFQSSCLENPHGQRRFGQLQTRS